MKSFSEYTRKNNSQYNGYLQAYAECYTLLQDIKKENIADKAYVNEGVFGDIYKSVSAFWTTTMKNAGIIGEKNDTRSEFEKALDKNAEEKQKQIEKNRKDLFAAKDKLKAAAVDAKGAFERNQLQLAHDEMMRAINAQIYDLNNQKEFWRKNKDRCTEEQFNAQIGYFNDILKAVSGKEKSNYEETRDLITSVLYQTNADGELEFVGENPDKIKNYLNEHPEVKERLNTINSEALTTLENTKPEELKALADTYCKEQQTALQNTPTALKAKKDELDAEQGALDAIKGVMNANNKENEDKQKKIDEIQGMLELRERFDELGDEPDLNTLKGMLEKPLKLGKNGENGASSDADRTEYAKKLKEAIKKQTGIDIEIKPEFINDEGEIVGRTDNDKAALKNELKTKVSGAKAKLKEKLDLMKNDAKDLGYNTDSWPPPKAPTKPTLTTKIPQATAKMLAEQKYGTDENHPTPEEISEFTEPETARAFLDAKQEGISQKRKEIEEKEKEYEKVKETTLQRAEEAHATARRKNEESYDKDFFADINKSKEAHIGGTVKDPDGKTGFYDDNGDFQSMPAPGTDERKEWNKKLAQSIINPSETQKQKLEEGLKTHIEIKKENNKPVYYKVTEDGTKTPVDKEEALKIQKAHEAAKKNKEVRDQIITELEKNDTNFSKLRKIPGFEEMTDDDIADLYDENTDADDEDSDEEKALNAAKDAAKDIVNPETNKKYTEKEIEELSDNKPADLGDEDWDKLKKLQTELKNTKERDDALQSEDDGGVDDGGKPKEPKRKITRVKSKIKGKHRYKIVKSESGKKGFTNKADYDKNKHAWERYHRRLAKWEKEHQGGSGQTDHNSLQIYLSDKLIVERFSPIDITSYLKKYFN